MTEVSKKSIHKQECERVEGQSYTEWQGEKDGNCVLSLKVTDQWILCLADSQGRGFKNY